MSKVYEFKDYDAHLSLRPGIGLFLVELFYLRPFFILLSSFSMGRRGGSGAAGVGGFKDLVYPDDYSLFLAVLSTVPALLFVYAWSRRKPGAAPLVRKLWKNGIKLFLIAAVLNITIIFVPLITVPLHKVDALGWGQVAITVFIIGYLLRSERVRDVFNDFPEEPDTEN